MSKYMNSYTLKGFIEEGSPHITWEISHINAVTVEEAIEIVRKKFTSPITISDIRRIMSWPKE